MKAVLVGLAALLTVIGTATAAPLSPPLGLLLGPLGSIYGALQMPGRYAWTVLVRDVETGASATATASIAAQ